MSSYTTYECDNCGTGETDFEQETPYGWVEGVDMSSEYYDHLCESCYEEVMYCDVCESTNWSEYVVYCDAVGFSYCEDCGENAHEEILEYGECDACGYCAPTANEPTVGRWVGALA